MDCLTEENDGLPHGGEVTCQGFVLRTKLTCENKAYYAYRGRVYCGVHCRVTDRIVLSRNATVHQKIAKEHEQECNELANINFMNFTVGDVICYKMKMMKAPPLEDGYVNVYLSDRHCSSAPICGLHLPSLGPKTLGPVHHNQPHLPPAVNLENWFHANKVYVFEIDESGLPLPSFYELQRQMYLCTTPLTPKSSSEVLFHVWVNPNGTRQFLTSLEMRHRYCHFYEQAVISLPAFHSLQEKIQQGYNLRLCGYEISVPYGKGEETIEEAYQNEQGTFSHEMILYVMLTYPEDEWMWRKYI